MNQTEIFELCENINKKHQCQDCKSFTEVGIINRRCGRNLKYNRSPKPNLDCNSIDGSLISKLLPRIKTWSNRMAKGHVAESKEERFSDNSRQMARTRNRSSLKNHDIGLERHDYTLRIEFSLWMLKGNNHLDNYAQITKKQHENVNDYKTNSWQQKSSSLHPSTQVNKDVKIQINNFKDLTNLTTLLIERQDGGGIMSSRETCRILRLRRLHHAKILLGNGSHGGGIPSNMMSNGWDFFIFLSVHAE